LLDRIKIYELQIQSYQSQSMMTRAIDIGFEALEALGINLSPSIIDFHLSANRDEKCWSR